MDDKEFFGKVALVTGAASGIGRATALAFAAQGANLVIVDVNGDEAEGTFHAAHNLGVEALLITADVANEKQVKAMIEKTLQKFGRLDYAFNNAGIEGEIKPTADCTTENWDKVLSINLKGVWLCMKYEIPQMLKSGGGVIVNCSSIAGLVGFAGIPAYTASKHGVLGLTKAAALEYAQSGIRVNAVCPGVIQTPMIDRFTKGDNEVLQKLIAAEPVGRAGRPEEIATAVLWLCSSGATFVTGHPLVADGGWIAQ